jgi:hypothetical protein
MSAARVRGWSTHNPPDDAGRTAEQEIGRWESVYAW